MEVHEYKFGFIPGSGETSASIVRRRFRLTRGGNPLLLLVHYTRGEAVRKLYEFCPQTTTNHPLSSVAIPPNAHIPVRSYPLRPVNEPDVFVIGPRSGEKVPRGSHAPNGAMRGPPPGMQGGPVMGMGGNMSQQAAMLAQQNNNMEMLDRRRARERDMRAAAPPGATPRGPPLGAAPVCILRVHTRDCILIKYTATASASRGR